MFHHMITLSNVLWLIGGIILGLLIQFIMDKLEDAWDFFFGGE